MITVTLQALFFISVTVFIILGGVIYMLIDKKEEVNQLKESIDKLNRSFTSLDDQAKLIVKTDLELNKTQEELDKRLTSIDILQKTARLISTTLDENEIFRRLDQVLITHLEYEKSLILIHDENHVLQNQINRGFKVEAIPVILSELAKDTSLMKTFKDGYTISSSHINAKKKKPIIQLFNIEHFVISPILTQNSTIGIFFVGNRSNTMTITEGNEEIISVLASQIGQSVENARLFEQVFQARQTLEKKVKDRTDQLSSALNEVEKISKTKSEFISAVSHELRTPLTSIKGYASILIAGKLGNVPEEVKNRLEKINTHSDNLVQLINNLLDISRIESGRTEMNMEKCKLPDIIANVEDLLTPQIKDKNIEWSAQIEDNIPEIMADSGNVERIFINLISNAIKFTPEKGTISVKVKLQPKTEDGQYIGIEVSDTGIGISKEDIDRLFDEFYRVENEINQNVKGTGLGLPLAKKIIEAHKGKIWITSTVGEGTTFHFTLAV